jgi:hypothetical protein
MRWFANIAATASAGSKGVHRDLGCVIKASGTATLILSRRQLGRGRMPQQIAYKLHMYEVLPKSEAAA